MNFTQATWLVSWDNKSPTVLEPPVSNFIEQHFSRGDDNVFIGLNGIMYQISFSNQSMYRYPDTSHRYPLHRSGISNQQYGSNQNINQQYGHNQNINQQYGYNQNINQQYGYNQNINQQYGYNQNINQQYGYNQNINQHHGYNQNVIGNNGQNPNNNNMNNGNVRKSPLKKKQCIYYKKGYCRKQNLRFLTHCQFDHSGRQDIDWNSAKFGKRELVSTDPVYIRHKEKFLADWKTTPKPKNVTKIFKINNDILADLYHKRKEELEKLRGYATCSETYLYHGTHESIIKEIFTKGFLPPADYDAGKDCPKSKHLYLGSGKASTSICLKDCDKCVNQHSWNGCHMYGLGIYFAGDSDKSNRYIKDQKSKKDHKTGRQMLVCSVLLGKCETFNRLLKTEDEMHNVVLPNTAVDSIYVQGLGSGAIPNGLNGGSLGVMNDEYILFHPFQALPEFLIEFDM